jgi:hypothetical protein
VADINTHLPTEHMLTTTDNPFDPFTEFDSWLAFDIRMGYGTASFLARVAFVPDEMSDYDRAMALELAMDEIVSENVSGMWKKVSRSSESIT